MIQSYAQLKYSWKIVTFLLTTFFVTAIITGSACGQPVNQIIPEEQDSGAQTTGTPEASSADTAEIPGVDEIESGRAVGNDDKEIRPAFDSPRATMFTFLEAVVAYTEATSSKERANALNRAVECLQMPADTLDTQPSDLVTELLGILNCLGEVKKSQLLYKGTIGDWNHYTYYPVDLRVSSYVKRGFEIPPFREDKAANTLYYPPVNDLYPEGKIELVKIENGEWRFSAETVADIDNFWDAVSDLESRFGIDVKAISFSLWLQNQMPANLRENDWLGLEYWQWLALLVIIFAGIVLDFVLRYTIAGISRYYIKRKNTEVTRETIKRMVRPFGLLAAGLFWLWLIRYLGLPESALDIILLAIRLIVMIAGVWSASRLVDLICEALAGRAEKTTTKFDDILIPLVRKTAKVFIIVFGLIYIADAVNIEILPLLTGLGIGGAAIAFASKDTIENFFGSIAVIVDKPFDVGDWVVIGDVEGTVETLGFRSTRVRTFYNSEVTIPNANLVRANVDNYGRRKYRRYKTHINITYDTPPDKIEAFCEGIKEIIRLHPHTRKDYYQVWLNQFAAASLDILIYIFHEAPEWTTELRERQRFMLDVIRLANRLGVEFAFPTQTLYMRSEKVPVPTESPTGYALEKGEETRAQKKGRAAVRAITQNAAWKEEIPGPVVFDVCALPDYTDDDEDNEHIQENEINISQIESTKGGDG